MPFLESVMSFENAVIAAVWRKGKIVAGVDPGKWRKDACQAWMSFDAYGNRDSAFGWEIDHVDGDSDDDRLSNLQPLHWMNNVAKGDGALVCVVTSEGNKNVRIG